MSNFHISLSSHLQLTNQLTRLWMVTRVTNKAPDLMTSLLISQLLPSTPLSKQIKTAQRHRRKWLSINTCPSPMKSGICLKLRYDPDHLVYDTVITLAGLCPSVMKNSMTTFVQSWGFVSLSISTRQAGLYISWWGMQGIEIRIQVLLSTDEKNPSPRDFHLLIKMAR